MEYNRQAVYAALGTGLGALMFDLPGAIGGGVGGYVFGGEEDSADDPDMQYIERTLDPEPPSYV